MFEPLKKLLDVHGDKLYNAFLRIETRFDDLIESVRAEVQYDEFTMRDGVANSGNGNTATVEITASAGYAWRVRQIGVTCGDEGEEEKELGRCAVYIGGVSPDKLIDYIAPASIAAKDANYYVPRGATIVFHFYNQPENQNCTVSFQAEQLTPKPVAEGTTGISGGGFPGGPAS